MYGRKPIYTDVKEVTAENIFSVLSEAWPIHQKNRADIQYLWDYYKGKQPVLQRVKTERPDILNKVVVNKAHSIVSFKSGYLIGEPIAYVNRSDKEEVTPELLQLNDYMYTAGKHGVDKKIIDWMHICGTAYRIILPESDREEDEAPFSLYSLDPRGTFVVYHRGIGHRPVLGVTYTVHTDNSITISAYTPTRYFEIVYGSALDVGLPVPPPNGITRDEGHLCGDIPIIEYPANEARLGAFEIVLGLLDTISLSCSDRIDSIEQFIQALLVLEGVDIDGEQFTKLKEYGGLCIPEGAKAYYLTQELNQSQTQTFVDWLDQEVLELCDMPNRNGKGSSTSDTGQAVYLRDGYDSANINAKNTETIFDTSEYQFLRIALRILKTMRGLNIRPFSIKPQFTRKNYDNTQTKAQVLTTMLNNDKIDPRLAFEYCGMFVDAELAYKESMEYYERAQKRLVSDLNDYVSQQTAIAQREAEEDEEAQNV